MSMPDELRDHYKTIRDRLHGGLTIGEDDLRRAMRQQEIELQRKRAELSSAYIKIDGLRRSLEDAQSDRTVLLRKIENLKKIDFAPQISLATKIMHAVSDASGIAINEMRGDDRCQQWVIARHIAMYLLRLKKVASYGGIARIFKKDHSTVVYACQKVRRMLNENNLKYIEIFDRSRSILEKA
jgi:chromosomal replication initiation ATPase DnaA